MQQSEQKIIELNMPSSAVWKIAPVRVEQYGWTGRRFPVHLIARLESVRNQPQRELSQQEIEKIKIHSERIVFDVLFNNLLEPRVTLQETEDSITPAQIIPEDLTAFAEWVLQGAQSIQPEVLEIIEDEESLLNAALLCREIPCKLSEKLKIDDELTAWQIDSTGAYLCMIRDNERDAAKLKALLNSFTALQGGKVQNDGYHEEDLEAY